MRRETGEARLLSRFTPQLFSVKLSCAARLSASHRQEELDCLFQQCGDGFHPVCLVGEGGEIEEAEIEAPVGHGVVPAVETGQDDQDEEEPLQMAVVAEEEWHKSLQ